MSDSVKLKDIADALQVSIVTVSNALSGKRGVSEEVRTKIIEKAEQDKINNFLYYNGTRNLVKHMRKRYPEIQNKQFVDGCHACYEIMKTYSAEQLLEIIKEIEGEEENV